MAGVTRREIDELTERARRFGAKGLAYLALEPGGEVKGPIAKFLSDDTQRAIIERTGAAEGDLILIVADTRRDHRRRPRPPARRARRPARPGRPERPRRTSGSTASRCTSGTPRSAAGTRPTTRSAGVLPEDEALLVTASGDPGAAVARRPGRARPGAPVRPRAQRLGARWRLDPDPSARPARAQRSSSRATRSRGCARSSGPSSTPSTTARRRTAGSPSASTAGRPCSPQQTNIREVMAFPKTQSGTDPMLEAPSIPEPGQYEELGLRFVGLPGAAEATVSVDRELPAARARAARLVRAAAAPRGPDRRDLHRVLRASSTCTPRSRRRPARSTARSSGCRCSSSSRSGSGGATVRCRARPIRLAAIAGRLLHRRPDVLAPRHRGGRRRPGDGPRQPPGHHRRVLRVAPARRAAVPGDPAGAAGRAGRRDPDLGRRRQRRVRREPAARRHPRHRDGDLLLGLPADHPARRPRPAPAGRPGRDRHRSSSSLCSFVVGEVGRRPRPDAAARPACSGWRCSGSPRSRPATCSSRSRCRGCRRSSPRSSC